MRKIRWGRLFRRVLAVVVAVLTLGYLALVAGGGALARTNELLEGNNRLVTAALTTELGSAPVSNLPFWQRLAVEQSALLWANPADELPPESAADEPELSPETTEEKLPALPDQAEQPDVPIRDDLTAGEVPETVTAPDDIVEVHLKADNEKSYVRGGGFVLYNRTNLTVDLAAAAAQEPSVSLSPAGDGPQILIIHTHATEAYTPDGSDVYVPSDNNTRTLDENFNVIRVGDEIERVFHEMGLSVIHDRGTYDYPRYSGSYNRSGPAVEDYLAQYPTIGLVLDIHRDALAGSDGTVYKAVSTVDGAKTAQVMLVIGTNAGGAEHPTWMKNLSLACRIQRSLDTLYPSLARPMTLRQSAYNQNLSSGSLLVEVGCHGNTLQEALAGARCFARAAGAVYLGLVKD